MPALSHIDKLVVLAIAVLMSGCAGIPDDRGYAVSQALVASHGGVEVGLPSADADARAQTEAWLSQPLTLEAAQRIALTRNPRLLEHYARLGIAQAEVYEAARISNPVLSLSWLDGSTGGAQIGVGLAQNFADLLRLSPRKRRAQSELAQAQTAAAADVIALAAEVEAAYHVHVGRHAVAELRERMAVAGETSAALAQRFFDAGNISRLQLVREQAAASTLRIEAERATVALAEARAALNVLLGLERSEDRWTLNARLYLPAAGEDELATLETLAREGNLELVAAYRAVAMLEDALGVAHSHRLLGDAAAGVEYERETDDSHLLGPTLALPLPLFDWGAGRVARAEAELDLARAAARKLEIEIGQAMRLAHARVASARRVIEGYRTQLIPQREEALLRAQEMQNFMLIGQFDLLLARREAYDTYQGYVEALTDYWVARAALAQAIGARLPSSEAGALESLTPTDLINPASGVGEPRAHDHAAPSTSMPHNHAAPTATP